MRIDWRERRGRDKKRRIHWLKSTSVKWRANQWIVFISSSFSLNCFRVKLSLRIFTFVI